MGEKIIEFQAQGFLKSTRLDREGSKTVSIEFSASEAVELAKLELMSRDLQNHQPVLLEVRIKQNNERQEETETSRRKAVKDKLDKFRTA